MTTEAQQQRNYNIVVLMCVGGVSGVSGVGGVGGVDVLTTLLQPPTTVQHCPQGSEWLLDSQIFSLVNSFSSFLKHAQTG